MDYKLVNQIISLIKSLNDEERKKFLNSVKGNPQYLELFKIILKHEGADAAKEKIENDFVELNGNISDLKENLLKKLIEFVNQLNQETNKEEFEIKRNIESINALFTRKQFELAYELINKTYKKLVKTTANGTNYHLYLQFINQVFEIQSKRIDSVTRALPNEFEDAEMIRWLNNITRSAAHNITVPDNIKVSSSFNDNLFLNLLIDYKTTQFQFEEAERLHNRTILNDFFPWNKESKDQLTSDTFKFLHDLNKIYIGLGLNDPGKIERILVSMENSANRFKEKSYETFLFLILQLYELRINLGMDTEYFELLKKGGDIYTTKKADLKIFTEREIEKANHRIEINKGLVHFFNEDYEKAFKQFDSISITSQTPLDLKYYIALYKMLAYRLSPNILNIDVFEKEIEQLTESKFKGNTYSKAFLKMISNSNESLNSKALQQFLEKHEPKTTFDKVTKYWILQLQ
jgi:hypothetical protein